MRKVDDREEKRKKEKRKKRMAFLVATTSLPAVYRPNGQARTTTAGTPHARANSNRNKYENNWGLDRNRYVKEKAKWIETDA